MKKEEFVGFAIAIPGVLILTAGILIIAGQIVHYLEVGYWTPVTVLGALQAAGLSRPVTSGWVGVQKMVDGFLGLSFSAVFIVSGIAIYGIGWLYGFGWPND
jgi:hypothetical protein